MTDILTEYVLQLSSVPPATLPSNTRHSYNANPKRLPAKAGKVKNGRKNTAPHPK